MSAEKFIPAFDLALMPFLLVTGQIGEVDQADTEYVENFVSNFQKEFPGMDMNSFLNGMASGIIHVQHMYEAFIHNPECSPEDWHSRAIEWITRSLD